jgi:hypothetical protein
MLTKTTASENYVSLSRPKLSISLLIPITDLRHKITVQIFQTHMDSYVLQQIFLPELSAVSLYHMTDI